LAFLYVLTSLDNKGARAFYYLSSVIGAVGPFFAWPAILIAYIVHATLNTKAYSSYSYIVVKHLLFFIYNLVIAFFALECLFPIYSWY